jgi:hypothetical protein
MSFVHLPRSVLLTYTEAELHKYEVILEKECNGVIFVINSYHKGDLQLTLVQYNKFELRSRENSISLSDHAYVAMEQIRINNSRYSPINS